MACLSHFCIIYGKTGSKMSVIGTLYSERISPKIWVINKKEYLCTDFYASLTYHGKKNKET